MLTSEDLARLDHNTNLLLTAHKLNLEAMTCIDMLTKRINDLESKLAVAVRALQSVKENWDFTHVGTIVPAHHPGEHKPNDSLAAGSLMNCVSALAEITRGPK